MEIEVQEDFMSFDTDLVAEQLTCMDVVREAEGGGLGGSMDSQVGFEHCTINICLSVLILCLCLDRKHNSHISFHCLVF